MKFKNFNLIRGGYSNKIDVDKEISRIERVERKLALEKEAEKQALLNMQNFSLHESVSGVIDEAEVNMDDFDNQVQEMLKGL